MDSATSRGEVVSYHQCACKRLVLFLSLVGTTVVIVLPWTLASLSARNYFLIRECTSADDQYTKWK
jgi:hypothetical protein